MLVVGVILAKTSVNMVSADDNVRRAEMTDGTSSEHFENLQCARCS
jgi:hypothetical protein